MNNFEGIPRVGSVSQMDFDPNRKHPNQESNKEQPHKPQSKEIKDTIKFSAEGLELASQNLDRNINIVETNKTSKEKEEFDRKIKEARFRNLRA